MTKNEKGIRVRRQHQLESVISYPVVCVCVCENHSLIKTAAWAALQRVEFTKSIQAESGRASLVFCLLHYIHCFPLLICWPDIKTELIYQVKYTIKKKI